MHERLRGADFAKVFEYLEKASQDKGDEETVAWVSILLAKLFYFGLGVEKNEPKVLEYCKRAYEIASRLRLLEEILSIVEIFGETEFLVHTADGDGYTPLHKAARRGHKEIVLLLLSGGASVKAVDKSDRTPYDLASNDEMKALLLLSPLVCEKGSVSTRAMSAKECLELGRKNLRGVGCPRDYVRAREYLENAAM